MFERLKSPSVFYASSFSLLNKLWRSLRSGSVRGVPLLLLTLFLIQCKSDDPIQKDINKRHDEIMVIHDEVMPKMRDIYKLKKKLKTSIYKERAETPGLIDELEAADNAMMDWMAQYKKPKSDHPEYTAYLDGQLKSVQELKAKMLATISKAEQYTSQ